MLINLKVVFDPEGVSGVGEPKTEEDTTIAEISLELGYKNPRLFSTAFKRTFGISPREIRKGKSF